MVFAVCSSYNSLVFKIRGVYAQFLVQAQSIDDPKDDGGFTSVILSSVAVRVIDHTWQLLSKLALCNSEIKDIISSEVALHLLEDILILEIGNLLP